MGAVRSNVEHGGRQQRRREDGELLVAFGFVGFCVRYNGSVSLSAVSGRVNRSGLSNVRLVENNETKRVGGVEWGRRVEGHTQHVV